MPPKSAAAQWNLVREQEHLYISSMAVAGSRVYCSPWGSGCYVSPDSGRTWEAMNTHLTNMYINTLCAYGEYLFAGTDGAGVFTYHFWEKKWTPSNNGLSDRVIFSLAKSGSFLVAAGWESGIFISRNDAGLWQRPRNHPDRNVICTVVADSDYVYAGTVRNGIFRVSDTVWLHLALENISVLCMAAIPGYLIAGTWRKGIYVFRKTDGVWSRGSGVGQTPVTSLAYQPATRTLYCAARTGGVFSSKDNGYTWTHAGLAEYDVYALAVIGNNLLAGSWGAGIYRMSTVDTAWRQTLGKDVRSLPAGTELAAPIDRGDFPAQQDREPLPPVVRNNNALNLTWEPVAHIRRCTAGRMVICFIMKNDGRVLVMLHDIYGHLLQKKIENVTGGTRHISELGTAGLSNGVYVLTLKTFTDIKTTPLVYISSKK